MSRCIIVTDLDGSLLDHYTYSYAPALPLLATLKAKAIPVVLCSSKTRAEMQSLQRELGLESPYIVENGAAIYIPGPALPPMQQLQALTPAPEDMGDEWRVALGQGRAHWQQLLNTLPDEIRLGFKRLSTMPIGQIADLTGLSVAQAKLAAQREFGEPLQWRGTDSQKRACIEMLQAQGATVLQGGRFLHVGGDWDKGRALRWLTEMLYAGDDGPAITIALGDSHNDVAMLEAADHAVVIRSPAHSPPRLERRDNVFVTVQTGPRGWVEGIERVLGELENP